MEASLIAESPRMTFREWSQRVRLVAELLDQDGTRPEATAEANRLNLRSRADESDRSAELALELEKSGYDQFLKGG